jgi:DNA repair exonuclease SbcCD nuclease subunit
MGMGKICVIGDLHFGIKMADERYLEYQMEEWDKFINGHCRVNDVNQIIILGDFFDNRNYLSVKMIDMVKKHVLSYDIDFVLVVGNHDTLYRNTNAVTSPGLIFSNHDNIKVIDTVKEMYVDDVKCLMLPWMNKENYSASLLSIKNTAADFCFAHLELTDFEMTSGIKCKNGLNAGLFKKFKAVFTGHFHLTQDMGNIHYIGSFYQTTWADCGNQKRIYFIEPGFADVVPVPMTRQIYKKIHLSKESPITQEIVDSAADCYVKVYLGYKTTAKEDKLLSKMADCAIKVDIIDLRLLLDEDDANIQEEDFLEIFNGFMEIQEDLDPDLKAAVTKLMKTTYNEALEK